MGIIAMKEKMFFLAAKDKEPVTTEHLAELEKAILKQIEQLYMRSSPKDARTKDEGDAQD